MEQIIKRIFNVCWGTNWHEEELQFIYIYETYIFSGFSTTGSNNESLKMLKSNNIVYTSFVIEVSLSGSVTEGVN